MADAFQCDRCGDFETGEPKETIPVHRKNRRRETPSPNSHDKFGNPSLRGQHSWEEYVIGATDMELCDSCAEALANFLNGKLGFPDP